MEKMFNGFDVYKCFPITLYDEEEFTVAGVIFEITVNFNQYQIEVRKPEEFAPVEVILGLRINQERLFINEVISEIREYYFE